MPLHRKNGQRFMPQRLNRTVVRPLYGTQLCAKTVNALMMRTVDSKARTIKGAEKRVVGARFMQAVNSVDLSVSVDVLTQRAAEGDVDNLQPAANAKNRGASRGKRTDEGKFTQIARFFKISVIRRRLPIETRVNVAAACEKQSIGLFGRIRYRETKQSKRGKVVWERLRQINCFHAARICCRFAKNPLQVGESYGIISKRSVAVSKQERS